MQPLKSKDKMLVLHGCESQHYLMFESKSCTMSYLTFSAQYFQHKHPYNNIMPRQLRPRKNNLFKATWAHNWVAPATVSGFQQNIPKHIRTLHTFKSSHSKCYYEGHSNISIYVNPAKMLMKSPFVNLSLLLRSEDQKQ